MEATVNQGFGRAGKVCTSGKVKNSVVVTLPNSETVGIVSRYEKPIDSFIMERAATWGVAIENVKRFVYSVDTVKTAERSERKSKVDLSGSLSAIVAGFDAMIDRARASYKANEISGREFGQIKARIEKSKANAVEKIKAEIHVSNSELPNSESIINEVSARFEKSALLAAYRKQIEFLTKVYTKTVKTERQTIADAMRTASSNLNRCKRQYTLCKSGTFRNVERMNRLESAIERHENRILELSASYILASDFSADTGIVKKVYTFDNGKFMVKSYTNWPDAISSIKRIVKSKVSAFAKLMSEDIEKAREIVASEFPSGMMVLRNGLKRKIGGIK